MQTSSEIGALAERVAENFYLTEGYILVARNFRLPSGEIDLILKRERELLFVEVKGRKEFRADEAWLPRWRAKKRRLGVVARVFIARHGESLGDYDELRLEIAFVTHGRVSERFEGEPFF